MCGRPDAKNGTVTVFWPMGTREDKEVTHYVGSTPPPSPPSPPSPSVTAEEGSGLDLEKAPGGAFELVYAGYRAMYRDF